MKQKRTRRTRIQSNELFTAGEVKSKKQKRVRRNKIEEDLFIEYHKGQNVLNVLESFLLTRKKYIKEHYTEQNKIVLFEWELYYSVLQRIKNGAKAHKLSNNH